jgi:hypothetical protein
MLIRVDLPAVGTDHGMQDAGVQVERNLVDGGQTAEAARQADCAQQRGSSGD